MKDDLFAQVYDFENLHAAYRRARAGKRYKPEVLAFDERQEENLLALRDELRSGAYRHGPYRHFIVNDSKKRSIMAAPFRDRVMHHALCAVIAPVFERGFIYDSYACRRGKGTHAAVARMRSFVRGAGYREAYILKCDISKYFASIDHDVLYALIEKKIRDERVLALVRAIIESAGEGGAGIPIGNLTSQLFANIYLNELDQFAKHELRIRRYIRYMDDFAVVDTDKRRLAAYRERIAGFVSARLKLSLHPKKSTIAPARLGVDFLGYRLFERRTRLRASTVRRFVKRTRSLLCGLEKMRGGALHRKRWTRRSGISQRASPHGAPTHAMRTPSACANPSFAALASGACLNEDAALRYYAKSSGKRPLSSSMLLKSFGCRIFPLWPGTVTRLPAAFLYIMWLPL